MKKRILSLLLALLMLGLCACGGGGASSVGSSSASSSASTAGVVTEVDNPLTEAYQAAFLYSIPPVEASHGEDYVIEWQDAGMEAHIRYLLGREEGDIRHSDVWDIQALAILPGTGFPCDIMLEEIPAGWDTISYDSFRTNKELWQEYGMFDSFPDVESLADLRHFDRLQVFTLICRQERFSKGNALDLRGAEQCANLKALEIDKTKVASLEALSEGSGLENLWLTNCGEVDPAPLAGLDSLSVLVLDSCTLPSLEPLAGAKSLRALRLNGTVYPSLEPLAQIPLESLDLGLSQGARKQSEGLDYTPLAELSTLVYLDLSNHVALDAAACNAILQANPGLRYLNIAFTPAADEPDKIDSEQLEVFRVGM